MAQDQLDPRQAQALDRAVIDTLLASETVAEAQVVWLSLFLADDLDDRPGLTDEDRLLRGRIRDARLRADHAVLQLRQDLDGDLAVTRAEILPFARSIALGPILGGRGSVAPNEMQAAEIVSDIVSGRMRADASGDDVVTLREMLDKPLKEYTAAAERVDPARAPFATLLDADRDGTITEAEFLAPLRAAAGRMDTNTDAILSRIEKQQHTDRPVPTTARQKQDRAILDALMPRRTCDLAPRAANAQLLVMGGYEGAALSNIEIGSEGQPSYVVDLVVSDGTRPLALVLAFQEPVIVRLSGASDRLSEVRTVGAPYGIVNRPRVPLVREGTAQGSCELNLWRAPPDEDLREVLRTWTGRGDVIVAAGYTVGTVSLGDVAAEITPMLPGGHQPDFSPAAMEVWSELLRYNPAGLIVLDPDMVDTPGYRKVAVEVWPQQAGLAQLVEAGALTALADRSVQDMRVADSFGVVSIGSRKLRWDGGDDAIREGQLNYTQEELGRWVGRAPPLYRINEPITLPAGLYGAHMAEFLLPRDVPEPKGDRADSRLRPDRKEPVPSIAVLATIASV